MSKSTLAGAASGKGSNNTNATKAVTSLGDDISGLSETLQGHVDDIRTLLQCGICIRPLYEPFTLACGHTFCYSCLTSWFAGGRSNKTCPDCRAPVKTQPAPAYLVRAVVQLFTSRAELLEKGETTAEHTRHQREEAERLENDKKNAHPKEGGLFRGTFNKKLPAAQPIVDLEDNVVRCPRCSWELEEDSNCAQCGYRQDNESVTDASDYLSDSEENSEMTDYLDDDLEDGFGDLDDIDWNDFYDGVPLEALAFDLPHHLYGLHRHHHHHLHPPPPPPRPIYLRDGHHDEASSATHDSEDEEEDYSEDTDMDSFIDDDEHIDVEDHYDSESDRSTVVGGPNFHIQDQYEHQLSSELTMSRGDDYTDDGSSGVDGVPDSEEDGESDGDEEEDEDDDEPIRPPVNGSRRRQAPAFRGTSGAPMLLNQLSSRPNVNPYPMRRPVSRTQSTTSAGTSVSNAINLDDDSDEGPVRPFRRNCRHAAR